MDGDWNFGRLRNAALSIAADRVNWGGNGEEAGGCGGSPNWL